MESFKIYFGNNSENIRRVSLPKDNFTEVVKQLYALYKEENLYHGELRIQYVDEEGDRITVSSQGEWEEMSNASGTARPIKLWIVEGMNPRGYFKDGPAPEPIGLVVDGQNNVPITGQLADTVSIVVDCLKGVFPGGVILPYNLPNWLKESNAITVKPVANSQQPTEDFVVDLVALSYAMIKQALINIRPESTREQLEEAKVFLETVLALSPNDANSHYNLACANALLGNGENAVTNLNKAYETGYNNVEHMQKDSDLESLRNMEQYKDLVKRMSQGKMEEDKYEETDLLKEFENLSVAAKEEKQEEVSEEVVQPVVKVEQPVAEEVKVEPINQHAEFVPFLLILGISEADALALLEKHQGNVERAADEFYSRN